MKLTGALVTWQVDIGASLLEEQRLLQEAVDTFAEQLLPGSTMQPLHRIHSWAEVGQLLQRRLGRGSVVGFSGHGSRRSLALQGEELDLPVVLARAGVECVILNAVRAVPHHCVMGGMC